MAIIPAILSFITRKLGQLLRAVFGWSITGLFGRLPEKKQTALSIALVLSLVWPLLVVGAFAPAVASWAIAFVPMQRWVPSWVLRIVWIALAVAAPPVVGAITAWVAPDRKQKHSTLRTVLQGYPLTLGFAISFLITLVVVPVLELSAVAHRWRDEHVFMQVREGEYAEVLEQVRLACERARIAMVVKEVPRAMLLATRVLKWFARGGLDPVVADDPRMLVGDGVKLYLYPADLLVRGEKQRTAAARAAVVRELLHAPAHLVKHETAQKLEDQLARMWDIVELRGEGHVRGLARARVDEINRDLERADIPYEDWVLLYMNLLRLDRAVATEPESPERALHANDTVARNERQLREEGRTMIVNETRPATTPTGVLIRDAVDEARDLIKTEVELAKTEVRQEVKGLVRSAIAFAAAGIVAMLALAVLLVAFGIATFPKAWPSLVVGISLLVIAGVSVAIGVASLPKKMPLEKTRERMGTDVQILKERFA
jgi:uncharacterized membrane protein YqjE